MEAMSTSKTRGSLVIRVRDDGVPCFEAKWRHESRQIKRRLGPAWVEAQNGLDAPARLRLKHHAGTAWMKRKGTAPDGWLSEDEAVEQMREVIAEHAERVARTKHVGPMMFETVAAEWTDHGRDVLGWKPSVARDYASMLHVEDRTPKTRGQKSRARVMGKWKGRRIESITETEVRAWLRELDRLVDAKGERRLSPRSVNKHRQVMHAICGYAVDHGYVVENVVSKVPKRKQPDAAELIVYSPEQVQAVAAQAKDDTMRALILTAAFSGLRMGELLALRWRDVDFTARRIRVARSYSQGLGIVSPKSGKSRSVPLADVLAVALDGLSRRDHFTAQDALVFTVTGKHIDPSTIRARFVRARDAAIKKDAELPSLRFHDLRHSFGTQAVSSNIDLLTVKEWMGHSDIKTTMGYLHFRENTHDADRLSQAFGGTVEQVERVTA